MNFQNLNSKARLGPMLLAALIVVVLIVASAVAIWSDPPRYPAPPDRDLDLDLRRRLGR
jgi:hypothetical protein